MKRKLSKSQRAKVERAVTNHDYHQGCYFWAPKGNAADRRWAEEKGTWSVEFKHEGHIYRYDSDVRVSARNYKYRGAFYLDGEKKTVALFRKLLY